LPIECRCQLDHDCDQGAAVRAVMSAFTAAVLPAATDRAVDAPYGAEITGRRACMSDLCHPRPTRSTLIKFHLWTPNKTKIKEVRERSGS